MKESIFDTCILQYLSDDGTVIIRTDEKEKLIFNLSNENEIDEKIRKLENLILALKYAKKYQPKK